MQSLKFLLVCVVAAFAVNVNAGKFLFHQGDVVLTKMLTM